MSEQIPLLHIPTKVTDTVDFKEPFSAYISTVYQEDPDAYSKELGSLNALREEMQHAAADVAGRDAILRYYGQLELAETRFPIEEDKVKITFTWYDAFSERKASQASVAFEKSCVMFNLAAVCSEIASKQNRALVDGLKAAYNYMQASAGYFQFIHTNFLHAPTTDMSTDSIKALSDLMLAQAQECFLEKVVLENKRGAIVSKLAIHLAGAYANVADALTKPSVRSKNTWLEVIEIKSKYFSALAYYHQSIQAEMDGKYGFMVAYVEAAEQHAKAAAKLSSDFYEEHERIVISKDTSGRSLASLAQSLLDRLSGDDAALSSAALALMNMAKKLSQIILERKVVAIKDNDIIYHEKVPSTDTLPPLDKACIAKPILMAEMLPKGQQDLAVIIGQELFLRLIPLESHKDASVYSLQKDNLVRNERNGAAEADQNFEATLQSLDYYRTISKLKVSMKGAPERETDLDADLRDLLASFQKEVDIQSLQAQVERSKPVAHALLEKCFQQLDQEQQSCENMRDTSFSRTSGMHQDLNRYAASLKAAGEKDVQLLQSKAILDQYIELFSMRMESVVKEYRKKVQQLVPSSKTASLLDEGADGDASSSIGSLKEQMLVEKLEGLVNRLKSLKSERQSILQQIRDTASKDDITPVLTLNPGRQEFVYQNEIAKYAPLRGQMQANIEKSQSLLADLSAEFETLKTKGSTLTLLEAQENARQTVAEEWRRNLTAIFDLQASFQGAAGFYSELRRALDILSDNVADFVNQRMGEAAVLAQRIEASRSERNQLSLQANMSKLEISSNTSYSSPAGYNYSVGIPNDAASPLAGNFGNASATSSTAPSPHGGLMIGTLQPQAIGQYQAYPSHPGFPPFQGQAQSIPHQPSAPSLPTSPSLGYAPPKSSLQANQQPPQAFQQPAQPYLQSYSSSGYPQHSTQTQAYMTQPQSLAPTYRPQSNAASYAAEVQNTLPPPMPISVNNHVVHGNPGMPSFQPYLPPPIAGIATATGPGPGPNVPARQAPPVNQYQQQPQHAQYQAPSTPQIPTYLPPPIQIAPAPSANMQQVAPRPHLPTQQRFQQGYQQLQPQHYQQAVTQQYHPGYQQQQQVFQQQGFQQHAGQQLHPPQQPICHQQPPLQQQRPTSYQNQGLLD